MNEVSAGSGILVIGTLLLLTACVANTPQPRPSGDEAPAVAARPEYADDPFRNVSDAAVSAATVRQPDLRDVQAGTLPVVHPAGRTLIFLGGSPPRNTLLSRAIDGEMLSPVSADGLGTPVFSADGTKLVFTRELDRNGTALLIHDVAGGATRNIAPGLRHILTPAPNADASLIVAVTYNPQPQSARLVVIDPATGALTPGPEPTGDGPQVLPRFVDRRTVIFIQTDSKQSRLMRWTLGESVAIPVVGLHADTDLFAVKASQSGLVDPLNTKGGRFAWFDTQAETVTLLDLAGGPPLPLEGGVVAGTWLSTDRFVGADGEAARLFDLKGGRVTLVRGRWAPRWAGPIDGGRSTVLVGQGEQPGELVVLSVLIVE